MGTQIESSSLKMPFLREENYMARLMGENIGCRQQWKFSKTELRCKLFLPEGIFSHILGNLKAFASSYKDIAKFIGDHLCNTESIL